MNNFSSLVCVVIRANEELNEQLIKQNNNLKKIKHKDEKNISTSQQEESKQAWIP